MSAPLRILFVSDLETLGGAGIGASRIANGLNALGVHVTRFVNNSNPAPFGEEVSWDRRYVGPARPLEVLLNATKRIVPEVARLLGWASSTVALHRAVDDLDFDVLHVHSLPNCYWNHQSLMGLPADLPTVWTFHDCWSFSGESQIYRTLAGELRRLKPDGQDRLRAIRLRRKYFSSREALRLVANSSFTAREAEGILGISTDVVHYGIPLDYFSPRDKQAARKALNLEASAFVFGFISDHLDADYKGFEVLKRALTSLQGMKAIGLAIGDGGVGVRRVGDVEIRRFGRVMNPDLLAVLYSAADVFVVPSLAEALGLVGLESIACGTPVVGSNVGGIPDAVRDSLTGWLFPAGDSAALGAILSTLAGTKGLASRLSNSCRTTATNEWGLTQQASRYKAIYEELLAAR